MWTGFVVAFILLASILYIPGFLILKALKINPIDSLCCSPIITVALLEVLAIIYPYINVPSSWSTMFLPLLIAGVAFAIIPPFFSKKRAWGESFALESPSFPAGKDRHVDWLLLAICVLVSLALVTWGFVKNLDGADSFMQAWDNGHHLSLIQAFSSSGNYSPLTVSLYGTQSDQQINPFLSDASFYPAAWHCLGAMLVNALSIPTAVATNATNAVCASLVLPTSMFALLRLLFKNNRGILFSGIFLTVAFAAFPWGFLTFGPLYPNLLSYAMVPAFCFCFIKIFSKDNSAYARFIWIALSLLGLISLALSQPNGVFTAGVFLSAFLVSTAMQLGKHFNKNSKVFPALFGLLAIGLIYLLWNTAFRLPFLSAVVSFNWPATTTFVQAIANAVFLSFVETPAQLILSLCVILGLVASFSHKEYRWLAFSYIFACIIYCFDIATDDFLKHFLSGFWYTDRWRTGAMAALLAVPLASLGMFSLSRFIAALFQRIASTVNGNLPRKLSFAITPPLLLLITIFPTVSIPGVLDADNAFTVVRDRVEKQNCTTSMNILDYSERNFIAKVSEIVPNEEVIINEPSDGSIFAYGLYGTRTYYRALSGYGSETSESLSIRNKLNLIATDPEVQQAVKTIGANYVLILDQGSVEPTGPNGERRRFLPENGVPRETWSGISSIFDDTPGFEVVLAEGDMRLYRIIA